MKNRTYSKDMMRPLCSHCARQSLCGDVQAGLFGKLKDIKDTETGVVIGVSYVCHKFKPKKINKSKVYDSIYADAERLFKQYDPCKHDQAEGRCIGYPKDTSRRADNAWCNCCHGCKWLSKHGCRVKSLSCKLWTCPSISKLYPEMRQQLSVLRRRAVAAGIRMGCRDTKTWCLACSVGVKPRPLFV